MGWMVPMMVASAQKQQEEKLLAELISKDKEDKYEFKILRGHLRTFRRPERLQAVLEEELRSQWEMVIKLDDESIVLRRPRRAAQAYDTASGSEIDPYRTQIGSRAGTKMFIILGILVLMGGMVAFVTMYNSTTSAVDGASLPPIIIGIAVGILMVFVVALKRNR